MIDNAAGTIAHSVAGIPQAPAQINLLHMKFKILVKTVLLFKEFFADRQSRTAGPQNLFGIVILAMVFFDRIKYSSPAERIAIAVQISACSAGVFKIFRIFIGSEFRLGSGCPG